MSDLAKIEPGQVVAAQEIEQSSIMAKVIELASAPGTNPEMFDRLVAWQEREQARQAETVYNVAMNAAQSEIQPVVRTTENKQTNSFYAKLEAVDAAIRPIYLKHGFSLSYNAVAPLTEGNIRIECRCSHKGHTERFYREAPADTLGPKGTPTKTFLHGGGSTETFLKRYLACGIFNCVFVNQDDDGNRGGKRFIGPMEIQELVGLLTDTRTDEAVFLERFLGYPRSLGEIEEKDFLRCRNALQQKKSKMQP